MIAWDWQWQMAWDPWEESQRPDWKIRAWRMQRDRVRRAKEFEDRRRLVARQESAALRRLREVRAERAPSAVKRSTATATASVGGAVPAPRAASSVNPYERIGTWYQHDYGTNKVSARAFDDTPMDLSRVFRQTTDGLISVDGRARTADTGGLERVVTQRGEVFWYDPQEFTRSGLTLRRGGASLYLPQVDTDNVIGRTETGGRILGGVGQAAPTPDRVYAWTPGLGLAVRAVDRSVWENGGTVQSLIEQWEAEQAKGATGGTQ